MTKLDAAQLAGITVIAVGSGLTAGAFRVLVGIGVALIVAGLLGSVYLLGFGPTDEREGKP